MVKSILMESSYAVIIDFSIIIVKLKIGNLQLIKNLWLRLMDRLKISSVVTLQRFLRVFLMGFLIGFLR